MRRGVEAHPGGDEHARADGDGAGVEEAAVEVDEAAGRDGEVRAVVDEYGGEDVGVFGELGVCWVGGRGGEVENPIGGGGTC